MLASSFLPAEQLNITEIQRDALMKVLVLLETGAVVHAYPMITITQHLSYDFTRSDREYTGHFNMGHWRSPMQCGTVACIGGTAELLAGDPDLFSTYEDRDDLFELFYPRKIVDLRSITPERAAAALRAYLTTGKPDWGSRPE